MINEKLRKLIYWEYFPFVVFTCLMLALHIFMTPFRDDLVYGEVLSKQPLLSLVAESYFGWSSRIIIMPITAFFASHNFGLFSIVDSFFYFLFPFMISKLFVTENKLENNWIIVLLLAGVPFITMLSTAGWVVTTIHYLWPLIIGLVALYPLKKVYYKETIRWYEYIIYIIATIFASNMEIMAAIIMTFYIIFSIFFIIKKTPHGFIIYQTLYLFGNMIFILTCPGNTVRDLAEAAARFPEYFSLNLIEKMALSATSTLISIDQNFITLIVLGMAFIFSWNKFKTKILRIICLIPLIFCLVINFIRLVFIGQKLIKIFSERGGKTFVYPIDYWKLVNVEPGMVHYIILVAMAAFAFSLILMTFVLFRDSKLKWIAILVMGAGIMSRVVIGFSPTVYASGARTFLFVYAALVIYGLLLYMAFKPTLTEKKQKMLIKLLCIFGILGYFESIIYLVLLNFSLK